MPAVLTSGHHANIERWRRDQSLEITARHRPDLLVQAREAGHLTRKDEAVLAKIADKL
ncbi:tRNA (guanine-N(1)-)-methyltransferase [compost metagenome]